MADLSATNKVTSSLMENPPPSIPDEQVEQIQTLSGKISTFLPLAEKGSFLLDKMENSEKKIVKVNKELGSVNSLIKKIKGEGLFARLFISCTLKASLANLTKQVERLQDPVEELEQLKGQIDVKLEEFLTEEATKKVEEAAAKAMEQNSDFIDKVASALGM